MVHLKFWVDFEQEVLKTNQKFYLYGVGPVCKKILPVIENSVLAIIDRNADKIKPINSTVPVCLPNHIFKNNETEYAVLCTINTSCNYLERTEEIQKSLSKYSKKITIYCLDYETISTYGYLTWNKKTLLIDNLCYLVNAGSVLPHMVEAYSGIEQFGTTYLKALYEEPIAFVQCEDRMGMKDFDNGFIVHKKGLKETVKQQEENFYKQKIWIFGDSRVSGMLLECRHTIASMLQKKVDENNMSYEVINCGVPGRDITRMVYQIGQESLATGDYVFLATGFYEYDGDISTNALAWCENIREAKQLCDKAGARFAYCNLPTMLEVSDYSETEKEMLDLFHTTEFIDYTRELIEHYKDLLKFYCCKNGIWFIDAADFFWQRFNYKNVFINLHHYGPDGSRMIGDNLFKLLQITKEVEEAENKGQCVKAEKEKQFNKIIDNVQTTEKELNKYILSISDEVKANNIKKEKTGCIVMNANPFTEGHLYLVKTALERVDFLIVFVVSEEGSYYSFEDRYEIVKLNLKEYKNVIVVPSGKFIISRFTFPEYFQKDDLQSEKIEMRDDLIVFAEKIAPALNISVRYVGEEPEDNVTRQYNETMKEILPGNGIEVVEIPRKTLENKVISASCVRRAVKEKNFESIKHLIPVATYEYLIKKKKQGEEKL